MLLTTTPDSLLPHQTRGGAKRRGRGAAGVSRAAVLRLLAREPLHRGEIRAALNLTYTSVDRMMQQMADDGAVIVIGTVEQAGKYGVRRDARVYALPGTELLPPTVKRRLVPRSLGSGQIAGPCYHRGMRWGAGW